MTPERRSKITHVLNRRQPDMAVVLENVEDPHNIFAVLRTCDAVGAQEVFVLNTRMKKHPKFGKKSSASAAGWLTVRHFEDTAECIQALRERYDLLYTTHLGSGARSLYQLDLTQRVALVFGNERKGISEELLAHSDGNFVIPQMGMVRSLNISVACAVTLYEALRQRQLAGMYNGTRRLPEEQFNALAERWKMYPEENG